MCVNLNQMLHSNVPQHEMFQSYVLFIHWAPKSQKSRNSTYACHHVREILSQTFCTENSSPGILAGQYILPYKSYDTIVPNYQDIAWIDDLKYAPSHGCPDLTENPDRPGYVRWSEYFGPDRFGRFRCPEDFWKLIFLEIRNFSQRRALVSPSSKLKDSEKDLLSICLKWLDGHFGWINKLLSIMDIVLWFSIYFC